MAASSAGLNDEQTYLVNRIAHLALADAAGVRGTQFGVEPLRRLLHRKPGTSESHTMKKCVCAFFKGVAGYAAGLHYQVAVLHATMSVQIDGDTLHHAPHIQECGSFRNDGSNTTWGRRNCHDA